VNQEIPKTRFINSIITSLTSSLHTRKKKGKKYTKKKSGYQKKQELIKRPRTFILNPTSTH
jgi:hypothetical protein